MARIIVNHGVTSHFIAQGSDVQTTVNLNKLQDVTVINPQNNEVLKYNSSTSQWENVDPSTIVVIDLTDLQDVTITTPADADFLKYNSVSGEWENNNEVDGGTF